MTTHSGSSKIFKLIINGHSIGSVFNLPHYISKIPNKSYFLRLERKNNKRIQYSNILTNRWNIISKKIEQDILKEKSKKKRQDEVNLKIHNNYMNYKNNLNSVEHGHYIYSKYN